MFIEPLAEKTFLAPAGRHVGFLRYRFPLGAPTRGHPPIPVLVQTFSLSVHYSPCYRRSGSLLIRPDDSNAEGPATVPWGEKAANPLEPF